MRSPTPLEVNCFLPIPKKPTLGPQPTRILTPEFYFEDTLPSTMDIEMAFRRVRERGMRSPYEDFALGSTFRTWMELSQSSFLVLSTETTIGHPSFRGAESIPTLIPTVTTIVPFSESQFSLPVTSFSSPLAVETPVLSSTSTSAPSESLNSNQDSLKQTSTGATITTFKPTITSLLITSSVLTVTPPLTVHTSPIFPVPSISSHSTPSTIISSFPGAPTITLTSLSIPFSVTSLPIETTESTTISTNITSIFPPDSSSVTSPSSLAETGITTMPPLPVPTPTIVSSDTSSSTLATTDMNTTSLNSADASMTTSVTTTTSETFLPSDSPSSEIHTTTDEQVSSITSEVVQPTSSISQSMSFSFPETTTSYPPTSTVVISLPSMTAQEPPRVSEDVLTSSHLTTKYWSSTFLGGSITTLSTIIETGVLSTNKPGDDNGFSHNTGAIIGVALAGTFSLMMSVVILFFACRKYKKRRTRRQRHSNEADEISRNSWHPPLRSDDDDYFPEYGRFFPNMYAPETAFMNPGESMSSASENRVGILPPLLDPVERGYIVTSVAKEIPRTTIHSTQDTHSRTSISNPTSGNDPYRGKPRVSGSGSNSRTSHTDNFNPITHTNRSYSMGSLHAGSSTHENVTASTSSGHKLLTSAMPNNTSRTKYSPVYTPPLHAREQESDGTTFRIIFGRLRRERDSIPSTAVRETSTTNMPEVPQDVFITMPQPSDLSSSSFLKYGSEQTLPPPFNITHHMEFWPTAPLPPSPTPSEHSRTLEGLLTPRLDTWLASSERSSTASLRDNVDYSRPITGLVRNRVHSNITFQTEDTIVTS